MSMSLYMSMYMFLYMYVSMSMWIYAYVYIYIYHYISIHVDSLTYKNSAIPQSLSLEHAQNMSVCFQFLVHFTHFLVKCKCCFLNLQCSIDKPPPVAILSAKCPTSLLKPELWPP